MYNKTFSLAPQPPRPPKVKVNQGKKRFSVKGGGEKNMTPEENIYPIFFLYLSLRFIVLPVDLLGADDGGGVPRGGGELQVPHPDRRRVQQRLSLVYKRLNGEVGHTRVFFV